MNPPHPFGTKRPSLEQHYYECFNLPNVDVLNIDQDPIERLTATGIKTKSGDEREFDVIVLATGFDAVTGSLAQLDFRNHKNESIADHWNKGLKTSIGIALAGFPNMFFLYGPQAPTAFSNGPTTVQVQAKWLDKVFHEIVEKKIERFDATKKWEDDWTDQVNQEWDKKLFKLAKSWYNGSNIPGKRVEPLNYTGGMPNYIKALDNSLENEFQGWQVVMAT
jgi:cation diffusion facilitator CzcD-associated flavoprotein CzcO